MLTTVTPDNAYLEFVLETTATCMEYCYPSACPQSKFCTGITTSTAILVDDLVANRGGVKQFSHFSQRYLRGLPQPEGLCAAFAERFKNCDEFYGSRNPRTGSYAVMGWLTAIDTLCGKARFAEKLPGQFARNYSRDRRTKWSVKKLPHYLLHHAHLQNFV